jgi:hypothetical protein
MMSIPDFKFMELRVLTMRPLLDGCVLRAYRLVLARLPQCGPVAGGVTVGGLGHLHFHSRLR